MAKAFVRKLPPEIRLKILLELPYDDVKFINDDSFWRSKLKKTFGMTVRPDINAKKIYELRRKAAARKIQNAYKNYLYNLDNYISSGMSARHYQQYEESHDYDTLHMRRFFEEEAEDFCKERLAGDYSKRFPGDFGLALP
jgi:hypothetical protein